MTMALKSPSAKSDPGSEGDDPVVQKMQGTLMLFVIQKTLKEIKTGNMQ
jgi:hypothetical protein